MVFILISSAVTQMLLPPCAFLGQAKFPFLLAVVLYYALNRKACVMLVAALCAGLLHDALSNIPLGYSVCCFSVVGWIAGRFRNLVLTESPVTPVFFGAAGGTVVALVIYVLLARDGAVSYPPGAVAAKVIGAGILGMISTPVLFLVAGKLDLIVGNVDVKDSMYGAK